MNLLITGATRFNKEQLKYIESMGHEVVWQQNESDTLVCSSEWVEGIICNGLFQYHEIDRFCNLKYVQVTSAGLDRVPVDYIKAHGIKLYNARGVYSVPMAEYALAAILQIYKKMDFFRDSQKQNQWIKNRNILELYGKRVCIVGCGSIGTECAKRFKAFGCEVIGIGQSVRPVDFFDEIHTIGDLQDIAAASDIIILTLPLTESTHHLFNRKVLNSMKCGSVLVNLARGAIIDTEALIETLEQKKIYAILDVFEEEPLPAYSPLWEMDNVIVTPHNSFAGEYNDERLSQVIFKNLIEWRENE